ncbi:MAG: CPBP family intramembrane metalloprotease [bacterium]|nr:MAG: CPBP family intramembrane metalloprotease [bacterium]
MHLSIREELRALLQYVRRNGREILIVCLATLYLVLYRYHRFEPGWQRHLVFLTALPALTITVILRENILNFGLKAGNCKLWIKHVVIVCIVCTGFIYAASRLPAVHLYYTQSKANFFNYILERIIIIFSIEFFFRGFLLFGVKKQFKEGAILIQMIPFAILHIGKPEIETIGCILSGTYLGYLAYRTNSLWPAFLIHLYANVLNKIIHTL